MNVIKEPELHITLSGGKSDSSLKRTSITRHAILHYSNVLSKCQYGAAILEHQDTYHGHDLSIRFPPRSEVFHDGKFGTTSSHLASCTSTSHYAGLWSCAGGGLCYLAGLHCCTAGHVQRGNAKVCCQPQCHYLHSMPKYAASMPNQRYRWRVQYSLSWPLS